MGLKDQKKKIRRVVWTLEKKYPLNAMPEKLPLMDQIVFHFFLLHAPITNAIKALRAFKSNFIDWNEVRVSRFVEIAKTLQECRLDEGLGFPLREILESAYAESNSYFFAAIQEPDSKQRKNLPRTRGMDPVVSSYLTLAYGKSEEIPLDIHTDRILCRVGVLKPKTLMSKRREELAKLVPEGEGLNYHYLFVEHGKKTCTEQDPACDRCAVSKECEFFRQKARGEGPARPVKPLRPTTRRGTTRRKMSQGNPPPRPATQKAGV